MAVIYARDPDTGKFVPVASNGAAINDETPSNETVYSGQKTQNEIDQLSEQMVNYRTAVDLLDNGAFQIAQAGYGGYHGTQKYAADRWECHEGLVVSKVTDGLQISATRDSKDGLWQYINIDTDKYNGKSLTAAVSVDGFLSVIVGKMGTNITKPANAINSVEMKLNLTDSKPYIQINVKSGYTAVINWVAFYEGEFAADTLPPYALKGYAVELAECQRYFQRLDCNNDDANTPFGIGTVRATSLVSFIVPFKHKMRFKPTVTISGSFTTVPHFQPLSGLYSAAGSCDNMTIEGIPSSTMTVGDAVIVRANSDINAYIEFSADL